MIRYLRLDMVGPVHNNLYCTLTYIQVYGKGMHQILKENLRKINEEDSINDETRKREEKRRKEKPSGTADESQDKPAEAAAANEMVEKEKAKKKAIEKTVKMQIDAFGKDH